VSVPTGEASSGEAREPIVSVRDLEVTAGNGDHILNSVSLDLLPGQSIGLVGESGSGKTALAHALLGFARPGLRISGGSVRVRGSELVGRGERELRELRGRVISYVPQDPPTALNPSIRVANQVREILRAHAPERESDEVVLDVFRRVELPTDHAFLRRYPHQLSGGQQQRLALALAIACEPPVIVLDEPTTGLDVITQATILEEVRRLQRELGVALVYVTHDMAAVASVVDRIAVMYAGDIIEEGAVAGVVTRPFHPYSRGLVSSVPDPRTARRLTGIPGVAVSPGEVGDACAFAPRCELKIAACDEARPPLLVVGNERSVRCIRWELTPAPSFVPRAVVADGPTATPLLSVANLRAVYGGRIATVVAVDDVSFDVASGECVALVGQSGSGKTTVARCVVGLHAPAAGAIRLDGEELAHKAGTRSRQQRRRIQIVFQNPFESLNPRQSVAEAVSWPALTLGGMGKKEARAQVHVLLERVRLPARMARRFPGELSGGERQRVAIARALAARPDLLVCDEVTSALDVSVQAATLDLLAELRRELGLAMLFITHDLGVVAAVADRVLVLDRGVVCEHGRTADILATPGADYTRRLVEAAPTLAIAEQAAPTPRG
jgi:peptide/nickel transport system ATP-binding protein